MKPQLNLFSAEEIESVCASARRILSSKGVRFVIPEALETFRKSGFQIVDGDVVRISPGQLEAALKTVPRVFVRKGANSRRDVTIGDGKTKFAVGSLPIWVIELEPCVRRRPATLKDLKTFTLLSEAMDGFAIGNAVVQPRDIPVEVMHLLWNRNGCVRMTKPTCCWYGTSLRTAEEGLEILRLAAGGTEELKSLKRWAITICPDSALQWGKSAIGAIVMAKAGVPVEILPMPFLGSTHPVTLTGALVQSAAETLSLAVLVQLTRPGCPVLYAPSYGGVMDMAIGSHSFGAPESALFAAAAVAVGKAFGLPTDMMQGTSDSKLPDSQAAIEKVMSCLLPALAGADCVTQAGALLDFALSASYEQLAIDNEIVQCAGRIARGFNTDDLASVEKEIMDMPFGGHHLGTGHTLNHFRSELYFPRLLDRRSWANWFADGAADMARRAGEYTEKLLAEAQSAQGVPPEKQKAVDDFAARICRKHGVNPEPLLY